jgi:hypothetical protein
MIPLCFNFAVWLGWSSTNCVPMAKWLWVSHFELTRPGAGPIVVFIWLTFLDVLQALLAVLQHFQAILHDVEG